jgi:hypothetical protein
MGDFFGALMFDADVDYPRCRLKRVIWWKRISQGALAYWKETERLMGKTIDSDIVVSLRYHRSQCHEPDDDETPEDEKVMLRIKALYKELGIQPRHLGKTDEWSHSGWWD